MMSTVPPGDASQDPVVKPELKVKGLPAGWRREVVVRKNGQSAGKTDVYYYSPCGKKFRSKPQIARFLGESADLTVFDFSRAGTPGDGSSRRRARDRTARRAVDVSKFAPPPIRPLTINPLRPSGPIRRTCGVIKLPVTWVAPPSDEELKLSATSKDQESAPPPLLAMDGTLPAAQPLLVPPTSQPPTTTSTTSTAPLPTLPKSSLAPSTLPQPPPLLQQAPPLMTAGGGATQAPPPLPDQPAKVPEQQQHQQQQMSHLPPPTSSAVVMMPALWENRLRGVLAYDHETGAAIHVNHEKLQNGLNHSATSGTGGGAGGGTAAGGNIGEATSAKGAVPELKLSALDKPMLNALLSKQLGKAITGHDDKKQLPISSTGGGVVPSLLAAHRKGVVMNQKMAGSGTSGGGIVSTAAVGLVPSLKNIQENGSLSGGKSKGSVASNILLTFPTMASANAFKSKQGGVVAAAVVSAAQRQNAKGSSGVTNGPPLSTSGVGPGMYVSESEVRIQEEKVKLLRKQLMAAQSTV